MTHCVSNFVEVADRLFDEKEIVSTFQFLMRNDENSREHSHRKAICVCDYLMAYQIIVYSRKFQEIELSLKKK